MILYVHMWIDRILRYCWWRPLGCLKEFMLQLLNKSQYRSLYIWIVMCKRTIKKFYKNSKDVGMAQKAQKQERDVTQWSIMNPIYKQGCCMIHAYIANEKHSLLWYGVHSITESTHKLKPYILNLTWSHYIHTYHKKHALSGSPSHSTVCHLLSKTGVHKYLEFFYR